MSSTLFEKVLHLKCRPSRVMAILLVLFHIAAIASIWVSIPKNQNVFGLLLLLVGLSFVYYFKKLILLTHPYSVLAVTQTRQGDWSLQLFNEQIIEVDLCGDSYKHPLFVVLNFKTNIGRLSVPLFPDALDKDRHRQLRCRLSLLKH